MRETVKKNVICLLITLSLLIMGCYLPNQPGPLPQGIDKIKYDTIVNIMGVVRNDSLPGQSFVFMINCFDIEENSFVDTSNIKNAIVKFVEEKTGREYQFASDTTIADTLPYVRFISPPLFQPIANTRYFLNITFPNGEKIIDSTTVPDKPRVSSNNVIFQNNTLFIRYKPPSHSAYTQIYISPDIVENNPLQVSYTDTSRLLLQTNLKADAAGLPKRLRLDIYAFNENYLKYQKTAVNLFFHQYNPTASTMDDAYGCFFAVSDTSVTLNISGD